MTDIATATSWEFKKELMLLPAAIVGLVAFLFEGDILGIGAAGALAGAACLILAIIAVSVRVAHHAEVLAAKVGDPYGTMILTLSAVIVEVIILVILMTGSSSPTLARDTIFSAVMLDINGILGLAALLGGWKFGEQAYNDDSGKTYGAMILTAMGISMVVPEFIPEAKWHYYSIFTIFAMFTLYWVFLRNQIGQHSYFFNYSYPEKRRTGRPSLKEEPVAPSLLFLIGGILMIGLLAEVMSEFLNEGLEAVNAPLALAALVVATMSAAPEILTALRAALANRMQVVINIALGASLSTVILTVPVIEGIALFTGQPIVMAMTPVQTVLAALTLIVAAINLNDGKTNAIEGITHFVLFGTFLALSFLGVAGG
ncbi:calcium:proton antiporter [Falsirhodobacter sp. 1013]|uniref:calcium:proton antiporter n=1 Tax=Falsirhodobacter sp. 1013 TaxID=3417566 RepID=UPI003EB7F1BD